MSKKASNSQYRKFPVVLLALTLSFSGCASVQSDLPLKDPRTADPFDVVDCLLPGQIRQLGTRVTYVTERRPIRTTAEDCAIRGGEYVALDRADYATALKVWMTAASSGDPDAQYYVGVLYEKGAEGQPNYVKAASWYQQAAERGIRRAAINLGRLYEQGLGVEKNVDVARNWFAKADGISNASPSPGMPDGSRQTAQQELDDARARLTERMSLLDSERQKLDQLSRDVSTSTVQGQQPEPVTKQAHIVKEREGEVAKLQAKVATLKEEAQQQSVAVDQASSQNKVLRAPDIYIVDPPVVVTRGIRTEQGRIPVVIPLGRPLRVTGRVVAEAGLRSLTVNGEPRAIDEQGMFVVKLESGETRAHDFPMDIVAVDRQNKQSTMQLQVHHGQISVVKEGPRPNTSEFGRYHALVIGNDHYKKWIPLKTAVADATAMAKILREQYDFQVTVLKDASRNDILKALNEYRKTLSPRDNLLVYYAGHGFLEPEIDRGYWIPIEGDLFDNTDWIEFPAITDLLELIPAKQILVVADSCFAGKLTRSALARLGQDVDNQGRQTLLKADSDKKIRATLTSGGAKPVLDDGGAGHSIFATALIGVLAENAEALETERLYWTVRSRVVQAAQRMKFEQIPTYGPIHMAGHEGLGDFVFVPIVR